MHIVYCHTGHVEKKKTYTNVLKTRTHLKQRI